MADHIGFEDNDPCAEFRGMKRGRTAGKAAAYDDEIGSRLPAERREANLFRGSHMPKVLRKVPAHASRTPVKFTNLESAAQCLRPET
jgi:hypothetical protein